MSGNLDDLKAFIVVAKTQSFTKAAGQLGVSQSALSYTLKMLEQRLAIKLLNRTTRSVSLTQEGEQLFNDIEPLLRSIEDKLDDLNVFRAVPQGKLRINGTELSLNVLLWEKLAQFCLDYPHIQLELTMDYAFTDIVKNRYDIGIRLGDTVDQDMISLPVSAPLEMVTVATPVYLSQHAIPLKPHDLHQQQCIGLRLPSYERVESWEFAQINDSTSTPVIHPPFTLVVSHAQLALKACLAGLGIAWLPKAMVHDLLEEQTLSLVLENYNKIYPAYYMYYPSRRESSTIFRLLVDALRWVEP